MAANEERSFTSSANTAYISAEESAEHQKALDELSELESQFAKIELDQQRNKEHALRPLYKKRQEIIKRIPGFWSKVFLRPPPQIGQYIQPADIELLTHLSSFQVERHEINSSGTGGDPRSLRLTFEFGPNDQIEDQKLVKELRYRHAKKGSRQGLVSNPVPVKWKTKKKDLTRGLGPCAVSLFEAENALRLQINGEEVDAVSREGLWQNERVLDGIKTMEKLGERRLGIFALFYYRGVDLAASKGSSDNGDDDDDDDDDADEDDLRDVEIYPDGSDLANFLAEHLWEDAVDIYVAALHPPESESDDDTRNVSDEDLPWSNMANPASIGGANSRPDDGNNDESASDVDPLDALDLSEPPNKKRRRH